MNFSQNIALIEEKIGYVFKDKSLITQAFTRTSFCNEHRQDGRCLYQSNEVLEFFGDSVLSAAIVTLLVKDFSTRYEHGIKTRLNEGDFSNIKSKLSDKKNLSERMREDSIAGRNDRGVFVPADNTKRSIYVSRYSRLRIFNTQEKLTKMLSGNTIDMRSIGREKTAVYVIVPDEKTTYHFLVTTFIKQVYEVLISEAQKEKDFKLPVRVNFVLDEFCNMPRIPDMPSMISAARSRNIRYYLVAQSLHQLRGKYGEDADTIKGNCDNWVFLTSKELDLLNEISELCGYIVTADKRQRKLISVSELQRLDKEKGEALIMHARQYPIITERADIDSYESFKGFNAVDLQEYDLPCVKVFSTKDFAIDVIGGEKVCPFSIVKEEKNAEANKEQSEKSDIANDPAFQAAIAQKFDELFGSNSNKP